MAKEPKVIEEIQEKVEEITVSKPERKRRIGLVEIYLVSITLTFIGLAVLARSIPYFSVDIAITKAIQQIDNQAFNYLMQFVSSIGFTPDVYFVVTTISILLYIFKLRWEAVLALLNAGSISIVTAILKTMVHRPRPTEDLVNVFARLGEYSFPSGHVMFYTAYFGYMFFLTYILLKRLFIRSLLLTIFASLIILVIPSRIYLGQHWASDTLGAFLFGSIWLILTVYVYDWGKKKF